MTGDNIEMFLSEVDRVRSLQLMKNPDNLKQKLNIRAEKEGKGFRVEITQLLPPEDEIRSFLLGFRKLYGYDKEPTNFYRMCNLVLRSDLPQKLKDIVALIKRIVKAKAKGKMRLVIFNDGHKNSIDYLIDLYFNGDLFHSDIEKAQELKEIKGTPKEPIYWYLLVSECSDIFIWIYNVSVAIRHRDDEKYLDEMQESIAKHLKQMWTLDNGEPSVA